MICFQCGKATDTSVHVCLNESAKLDQIMQKLDKALELLEFTSDEDEDKILLELAEKGVFQQLISDAQSSSSSSDWKQEFEDI